MMEYIDIGMFMGFGMLIEAYTGFMYKLLVKVGLKK